MRALMTRHLQDDKGKTQFEDHLQGDQAAKSVVITLFGTGKKVCDQQNCYKASKTGPSTGQYSEYSRPIQTQ
jgi:hypothetical protein